MEKEFIDEKDKEEELIKAVTDNNLSEVQKICSKAVDIDFEKKFHFENYKDAESAKTMTPLAIAVDKNFTQISKFLIEMGANTDYVIKETLKDTEGTLLSLNETPIAYRAIENNNDEIIKFIFKKGANPNLRYRWKNEKNDVSEPLLYRIIGLFAEFRVDTPDEEKRAINNENFKKSKEILKVLLDNGVDIRQKKWGKFNIGRGGGVPPIIYNESFEDAIEYAKNLNLEYVINELKQYSLKQNIKKTVKNDLTI